MKTSEIQVKLLDYMGKDISVVNAARVSFNKESEYLYDELDPNIKYLSDKDYKLLQYLAKNNHHTPFGHCFLSFRIKAPIFIARQLAKHQVGLCWNEVSRRYIDDEPEFYFPKSWRMRADNIKQGSSDKKCDSFDLNTVQDIVNDCLLTYLMLLENGVCPEQARMILPQNTMTEWIWSGSLLAFIRICNLRLDNHAQKETQEGVKYIQSSLEEYFPNSWEVSKNYNANI